MFTLLIIGAAFIGVVTLICGVAFLMRGETSSSAEDRLDLLTSAAPAGSREAGDAAKRNLIMEPFDDGMSLLEEYFAKFFDFKLLLDQAEVSYSLAQFLMICGGLGAVGAGVCIFFQLHFLFAIIAFGILFMLPWFWILYKRGARFSAFAAQLPEALELVARALRAGHSLGSGMQLVATEMPAPIGEEFRRAYEQQTLGVPLEEALEEMTERIPNLDLRFFATAVILQRQTGGDLAEILDKIGHLVRERFKILGHVQALTGEGRLSGVVLLALPPVLFITMLKLNPGYVMMLFNDDLGKQMLAVAVAMQLVGAWVIKQIVDIRV
jgi:tight adherence protein B